MFCKECGEKIAENSKFCRFCGCKIEPLDNDKQPEENINQDTIIEEVDDPKSIELTDNIDVTKIVLETDKEALEEKNKTQDFEEVLNDINSSIDKMNDEIPSPGETKSAKDKSLDPSKEIKNILEEFNNDEIEANKEVIDDKVDSPSTIEEDLEKTSIIVDGNIVTAAESVSTIPNEDKKEPEINNLLNNDVVNNDLVNNNIVTNDVVNNVMPTNNVVKNDLLPNNNDIEEHKSKHIVLPIILGILLLVSVVGLVYMYMLYSKSQDEIKSIEKDNKSLEEKIKQAEMQKPQEEEKTKYYLEGYEIALPTTNSVAYINSSLLVKVDNSNIYTYIKKGEKYSNIKNSMWKNKSIIESDEYKVIKNRTKVVSSKEYVVYEIENTKGIKYLVAYTDINGKDVIAFVINNKDNNTTGKELTITNDMVDSLKENKNIIDTQINIFSK